MFTCGFNTLSLRNRSLLSTTRRTYNLKQPLVTIVIPNWNGRAFLEPCLRGLERQTFTDYVVIVVDNGSTDGSVEWVKRNYPRVQVIANEENRGFAAAGLCVGTGSPPGPFGWILSVRSRQARSSGLTSAAWTIA